MFILALLWIVESFEPKATQLFALKVKAKDPAALKPKLEQPADALPASSIELRRRSQGRVCYDVHLPLDRKTDRLSDQILELDPDATVEWEEKKEKK